MESQDPNLTRSGTCLQQPITNNEAKALVKDQWASERNSPPNNQMLRTSLTQTQTELKPHRTMLEEKFWGTKENLETIDLFVTKEGDKGLMDVVQEMPKEDRK